MKKSVIEAWRRYKDMIADPDIPEEIFEEAREEYMQAAHPELYAPTTGERPSGHPRFFELLDELKRLHKRKNAGYAGMDNPDPLANFRESTRFGVSPFEGCLVRLSDKFVRVTNLARDSSNEQVGESLADTLMDLAAYSLIALILLEEE